MELALVGDIHKAWDSVDADWFNRSDYEAILFVGDLPGRSHRGILDIARRVALLTKPALLLPGNHDAVSVVQLLAELKQNETLIRRSGDRQEERVAELADALGPVELVGYSRHIFEKHHLRLDVIAARPHSMGGPFLSYRPYLERAFAVASFEDSVERLRALVDEAGPHVVFLAHNGPTGLGAARDDIFGCDFQRHGGDFGDRDLSLAIDYAQSTGRQVVAVLAGHMHHTLKGGGGPRRWFSEQEGVPYVNAARVPRVFLKAGRQYRHHVALRWDGNAARIKEIFVTADGEMLCARAKSGTLSAAMGQDFPLNCRR